MILVQNLFGFLDIQRIPGFLMPRHGYQPIEIVADDRGFRRNRRHVAQLFEFFQSFFFGGPGHTRFENLFTQFSQLAVHGILFAELFLDHAHLFLQIKIALRALDAIPHLLIDLLLDLENLLFRFQHLNDKHQLLYRVFDLENLLFQRHFAFQVRTDVIQ